MEVLSWADFFFSIPSSYREGGFWLKESCYSCKQLCGCINDIMWLLREVNDAWFINATCIYGVPTLSQVQGWRHDQPMVPSVLMSLKSTQQ